MDADEADRVRGRFSRYRLPEGQHVAEDGDPPPAPVREAAHVFSFERAVQLPPRYDGWAVQALIGVSQSLRSAVRLRKMWVAGRFEILDERSVDDGTRWRK